MRSRLFVCAALAGSCLLGSWSVAHAADPKAKKAKTSDSSDAVINKQMQWEDSVMGPDDKRAELDLQINLLAEHEITRLITMMDAVIHHFGIPLGQDPEVEQLKKDVAPELVLNELEEAEEDEATGARRH